MPRRDLYCGAAVALIALLVSALYVFAHVDKGGEGTGASGINYGPAALIALGKGFVDSWAIDEMRPFLRQESSTLTYEELPDPFPHHPVVSRHPLDPWSRAHIYLLYYVALVWKVFGVSWYTFKLALIPPFVITAICCYGLLRLLARPVASTLGTLAVLSTPAFIEFHQGLRDFAKVPFIFAVLLVAGILIRHPSSRRALVLLSLLGGAILGLGYGFRQDLLVFLPVLLAAATVGCHGPTVRLRERLAAGALTLVGFTVVASPILVQIREEGGLQAAHDLLMGWGATCLKYAQLEPPSYDFMPTIEDDVAFITRYYPAKYHREGLLQPAWGTTYDAVTAKDLLLDSAYWFPADWATRGFGAVRTLMTSSELRTDANHPYVRPGIVRFFARMHQRIGGFTAWFAPAVTLLALLWLARRSPVRAWLLLFLLLYILGYTSLQFSQRHVFHLTALPLLLSVCGLDLLARGAQQRYREKKLPPWPGLRSALSNTARIFAQAVAAVLVLGLPYAALLSLQDHRVGQLVQAYRNVPLEETEFTVEEDGDRDIIRFPTWSDDVNEADHLPAPWLFLESTPNFDDATQALAQLAHRHTTRGAMLALCFEETNHPIHLDVHYADYELEHRTTPGPFRLGVDIRPPEYAGSGRFIYFLPLYETHAPKDDAPITFEHIALHRNDRARLTAIYRVDQMWRLPLQLHMTLPRHNEDFQRHWRLGPLLAR